MPRLDRRLIGPFPCEVGFGFRYNFGLSKPFSTNSKARALAVRWWKDGSLRTSFMNGSGGLIETANSALAGSQIDRGRVAEHVETRVVVFRTDHLVSLSQRFHSLL